MTQSPSPRPATERPSNPAVHDSAFLKALRGEPASHTPVWFMRQAGRYMPEYRALRAGRSMLDCIRTPELAAEITLQPIKAMPLDAAILFNDILTPLPTMGLDLDFVGGVGPQIANPVSTTADVDRLGVPSTAETMPYTAESIRLLVPELNARGIPLIGFVGAPFTLASYAIEGKGSRNYERTKRFMYAEPAAWERLMGKFEAILADYLTEQVKAGASAVQIFDSWVGALSIYDYRTFVKPATSRLIERVKKLGVPVIYFGTGTTHLLPDMASLGTNIVGADWRLPLNQAWDLLEPGQGIQGNLDPLLLQAPWRELRHQTDRILGEAAGRPGHVFNVGHGILPETSQAMVHRLTDYVHEQSQR
ncbi:uroporphyrinogen decarboxylase [Deinococcus malanensis]|uniref:Uroporphyrinogen decarboxylase n=1 Tax=Deinococcus malanensis TaxID=1706855 RepID=A0ABQ2EXB7_9DEIO|nr:uroporphyrinogen decarboxylase [Deinococcus malanensis]GGK26291.1 uroporphyrinogen decarboxylase [Deinococcus malanensis]